MSEKMNYDKIARVMKFLGWKYQSYPESPTAEELKATHEMLLKGMTDDTLSNSTGGFRVYRESSEDGDYIVTDFVLDTCEFEAPPRKTDAIAIKAARTEGCEK